MFSDHYCPLYSAVKLLDCGSIKWKQALATFTHPSRGYNNCKKEVYRPASAFANSFFPFPFKLSNSFVWRLSQEIDASHQRSKTGFFFLLLGFRKIL
ncbi:hypothetical protein AHAS_Ahas20G0245300 [Arachis hypogaea]